MSNQKTVTIFSNLKGGLDLPYTQGVKNTENLNNHQLSNCLKYITLIPGYTTTIPQEAYDQIKINPIYQQLDRQGDLMVVDDKALKITPDKYGKLEVKERGKSNAPIVSHQDLQTINKKYVPNIDFLTQFKGVGKSTANDILNSMPENGWDNFSDMKTRLQLLPKFKNIDFSQIQSTQEVLDQTNV